jgi:phosphoribulokinase
MNMNLYVPHGRDEDSHSIFGDIGPYKGLKGVFSPFNPLCEVPPKIYKDSIFVGVPDGERTSFAAHFDVRMGWIPI